MMYFYVIVDLWRVGRTYVNNPALLYRNPFKTGLIRVGHLSRQKRGTKIRPVHLPCLAEIRSDYKDGKKMQLRLIDEK